MRDLTAYVVDAALAQAARWRQDGLPVQVSVNLSARDMLDAGLAGMVERGLHRHGLLPGELMLEINEAVLASEPAHAAGPLAALAALGVPLSLDDFGTGYSSLVRLRRLPVSEIKIDSSFITRLFDGPDNELIVRSLVDLVRALGIRSVAEGVESPEVAAALAEMGCDAAQGRYYCGPLDPAAATAWLADHTRPAARAELQRSRARFSAPGSRAGAGSRRAPDPPAPVGRPTGRQPAAGPAGALTRRLRRNPPLGLQPCRSPVTMSPTWPGSPGWPWPTRNWTTWPPSSM